MSAMITRIEIDGFKSFRQFSLDLEPFQIIVGPNSAGKSNLFDALHLLSRTTESDLFESFGSGRGKIHEQFARIRSGAEKMIAISIDLLLPANPINGSSERRPLKQTRFRYHLGIERRDLPDGREGLHVAWERLSPIRQADDTWIAKHPELAKFARYGIEELFLAAGELDIRSDIDDRELHSYSGPGGMIRDESKMAFSVPVPREATLLSTHGTPITPHVYAVKRALAGLRFPIVDLGKLRQPSERAASEVLMADGSNLPTVLAASPATAAHVRVDLADLVPGVRSFDVVLNRQDYEIQVEFTDGEKMPASLLSDGTLRLLVLLTLVRSCPAGATIAHEEPENGIFPGRLRDLLAKVRSVTLPDSELPIQLLLNSHSPVVLSILDEQPASILYADLIRRPDGLRATRIRPVAAAGALDRGAESVSRREVERALEVTRDEGAQR